MGKLLRGFTLGVALLEVLALFVLLAACLFGWLNEEGQSHRLAALRSTRPPLPEASPSPPESDLPCHDCLSPLEEDHTCIILSSLQDPSFRDRLIADSGYWISENLSAYTRALAHSGREDDAIESALLALESTLRRTSLDSYPLTGILDILTALLHEYPSEGLLARTRERVAHLRSRVPTLDTLLDQYVEESLLDRPNFNVIFPSCREFSHLSRLVPTALRGRLTDAGARLQSYLLRLEQRKRIGHVVIENWSNEKERVVPLLDLYECRCVYTSGRCPKDVIRSLARVEVQLRLFEAYLRAAETRLRSGAYPHELDAGLDPLSGKPILYRSDGYGVDLIAVAFDGREDGSVQVGVEWVGDFRLSTRRYDREVEPLVPLAADLPWSPRPDSQSWRWILGFLALVLLAAYLMDVRRRIRAGEALRRQWIGTAFFVVFWHALGLLIFWRPIFAHTFTLLALGWTAPFVALLLLPLMPLMDTAWKAQRPALAWFRSLWGISGAAGTAIFLAWPALLYSSLDKGGREFEERYLFNVMGRDALFVYYWESGGLSCSQYMKLRRVPVEDFFQVARSRLERLATEGLSSNSPSHSQQQMAAVALDVPFGTPMAELRQLWQKRGGVFTIDDRRSVLALKIYSTHQASLRALSPYPHR